MNGKFRGIALLGAFAVTVGLAQPAFADSASANTSATVLQNTTVSSLLQMDFGTIASNGTGGIVSLDAASSSRGCGVGMACSGAFAFATLLVTGDATSVQLNYDPVVQLTGPGIPMNATINYVGGQGAVVSLVNGNATIHFGADLLVNPNQTAGAYNGTFSVSVNYQ